MAINAADVSITTAGAIRWTGGTATFYTVLELHRFLNDLADDAQAAGDDLIDITTDTPSDRSTDQIVTLNSPFNIDDTMARHLYDGSVAQNGGDDLYSGLRVLGTTVAGTEIIIVQDDKVLPAWWGTGVNADAPNAVVMRLLVKTRKGGADIDGKRILCLARELGDQFKEFPVTMGLANSVAAISTAADLNNTTSDAGIEAWTTIANVEGFQLIDIDGDGSDEEYYAQFDKGIQSINDTYERTKWVSQRSHVTDSGTDTGNDFIVDNATIVGQGQEFSANAQAEQLSEARFRLKINAGTPTGPLTAELYLSDDAGAGLAEPTGATLATSDPVLASLITSAYAEVIFRFNDNVTLTASEEYFIVIRHPTGAAGDNFAVEGNTAGADDGNRAEDTGTWAATAADDLSFSVKTSPVWHGRPGEFFRGITQEVVYDTGVGTFTEDEVLFWATKLTYDNLGGSFVVGEYVRIEADGTGVAKNGGKVLKDSGTILWVALEDSTSSNLLDNDDITGLDSGATAKVNVTIVDQDKAGGEGVLLALDDNTGTGDFYIQLISGSAPVDNLPIEGRSSGATSLVNVTVTGRTVSAEFIGQSTGSNIIGAYGIGFETTDVGSSDKLFDLTNTQRTPPNNVTFTVTGLVSGEDRVLVGPRTGSALDTAQFTTDTALVGGGETVISIATVAIPTDTPTTGTGADNTRLRVQLDTGILRRQAYTSYDNATPGNFTIAATDYSGANQAASGNDVFVAYVDVLADATTEAYTAVYDTDRDLLVRVRDGGATPIKTFEANGTFGSTSSSLAAIRTSDA